MRAFSLLLPLALVVVSASCSSSKSNSVVDPYKTETLFCQAWAKAACNAKVVAACSAASVQGCVDKASTYCLGLVPPNYDSKFAKVCITAVQSAFADAKLTAADIAIVRDLGAPCDKLNKGPLEADATCSASDECDSLAGLTCIIKPGDTQGTCQVPVEVGGGYACTAANQICAKGFYCDGNNCIARVADGQTCDVSTPCLEESQCLGTTGNFSCVPKGDTSATCTDDSQCKSSICAKPATGPGKCVDAVILTPTDPMCSHLG